MARQALAFGDGNREQRLVTTISALMIAAQFLGMAQARFRQERFRLNG